MKKAKDLNELASQHMANILIARIHNKVACNFRLEDLKFWGKTWFAYIRKKKAFEIKISAQIIFEVSQKMRHL